MELDGSEIVAVLSEKTIATMLEASAILKSSPTAVIEGPPDGFHNAYLCGRSHWEI